LIACVAFVALLGIEAVIAIQTVPDDDYRPPSSAPRTFAAQAATANGAPTSGGEADAAKALRFVVLGDSTATGRGAPYERGIAVRSAKHLAASQPVTLRNLGVSGARFGDVRREQLTAAAYRAPDVVLIAAGANDVTGLTRLGSIRKDLRAIADRLRAARCDVAIVVTGSGDVGSAPRLAQPLRTVAGWRTKQVNGAIEAVAREQGLVYAPLAKRTGRRFRADRSLFAADGFHPSAAGYGAWMAVIEAALDRARHRDTPRACPSQR
jgi:lysophospholipase L1-like esterase